MTTPVERFDAAADAAFDRLRGHRLADRLFYAASWAGDWSRIWHVLALVVAIVSPRRRRAMVQVAICLGVESLLVNQGLKRLFRRARPTHDGKRPHHVRTPSTSSFPSGHATSAVVAASLLSVTVPKGRAVWWPLAAVIAASRVHVRIHHASDVAGGVVVGAALAAAARRAPGWRAAPGRE
ncbi:MAG: phosphatase PAP2 family protein [Acidimicrobiales bacterium]